MEKLRLLREEEGDARLFIINLIAGTAIKPSYYCFDEEMIKEMCTPKGQVDDGSLAKICAQAKEVARQKGGMKKANLVIIPSALDPQDTSQCSQELKEFAKLIMGEEDNPTPDQHA